MKSSPSLDRHARARFTITSLSRVKVHTQVLSQRPEEKDTVKVKVYRGPKRDSAQDKRKRLTSSALPGSTKKYFEHARTRTKPHNETRKGHETGRNSRVGLVASIQYILISQKG